ncbi:tRNA 2-thiocytidine biosynthesis protein ttca [Plakobranchus ocellatus]|uniref:tRNA 2-thiocytidine biosynthesis protein ttca n=1 Tax=Plakobranchus ocellatus TaxID=259542 RepID=A0AAV4C1Z7_9GAST|nr:tRNA 2-thiocytidine biosynthesis protein ttca [Plakobranchus ocellatus]
MAKLLDLGPANRQFYSLPCKEVCHDGVADLNEHHPKKIKNESNLTPENATTHDHKDSILQYIAENVIGADKTFSGPFGLRKVTYLDFVASGRALHCIEDYIRAEVLPEYGNTHTTTSVTSLQTTLFRHEARDILRNSFNASEHDSVIFTGSGSTGAVHKLIHALDLQGNPLIVLVGPYEHHSNILPWKEAGAEVVRIRQTEKGSIDMEHLELTLKTYQGGSRQLIGAFSAASNVTGVLTDVDAVTICLHKHGALAVWDYACAAPYVKLDMNPYVGGPDQPYVYKDAVVLSIHKFVGGISTPGVLMAKKKLFRHQVPEGCGGGTVFFVRRENHRYLQEPESKEEGGTPAIVQSIRAGLVVQLKQAVGVDTIHSRDQWLLSQAQTAWADCAELIQLGPRPGIGSPDKLPIFSFLVLHKQTCMFLHHNFVAAILNDVFGIQARGGCACAGPYAMDLLGLDEEKAKAIEELIAEDSRLDRTHLRRIGEYSHREILRPGFVRLNLPYFMDEACLQFVLEAVRMTAEHGWKLLPQYLFNPETAEWRQRHFQTFKDRKWLGHISYQSGQMKYHQPKQNVKGPLPTSYQVSEKFLPG